MRIIADGEGPGKMEQGGGVFGQIQAFLSRIPGDAYIVAIILLASSASFGLGFLSGRTAGEKGELQIQQVPLEASALPAATVAASAAPAPGIPVTPARDSMPAGGEYVASKSGTKYYLPWCGTVKNIKEENKVWFTTKAEAEAKGYSPATNCPGL